MNEINGIYYETINVYLNAVKNYLLLYDIVYQLILFINEKNDRIHDLLCIWVII
jgi:hypothetical protein